MHCVTGVFSLLHINNLHTTRHDNQVYDSHFQGNSEDSCAGYYHIQLVDHLSHELYGLTSLRDDMRQGKGDALPGTPIVNKADGYWLPLREVHTAVLFWTDCIISWYTSMPVLVEQFGFSRMHTSS